MADTELVKELDRNMDDVFDNLNVINSAITAFAQVLQPEQAKLVVDSLDECLDSYDEEANPPSDLYQDTLRGWRNMAAMRAELPKRLA